MNRTVTVTLPDGSTEEVVSNEAVLVHGADEQGRYIGLVPEEEAASVAPGEPPSAPGDWRLVDRMWLRMYTLQERKVARIEAVQAQIVRQEAALVRPMSGIQAALLVGDEPDAGDVQRLGELRDAISALREVRRQMADAADEEALAAIEWNPPP